MSPTPGSTFGGYELAGAIGSGGMGEVYRARDPDLKRDVAIKFISESMAGDAQRLARFRREAELLAALNHTNIARVYDLAKDGNRYAIVMELVEGSTLAELIARGPIPLDEALGIAHQIGAALEAAHERGIVHRDLKPANVMVGKDGVAKVLDFGIAREIEARRVATGSDSPAPALTEVGSRLGTANYMSPEQARGKLVDRRADIWAFGCVLYEMLVGTPAFGGEDESTTLARVLEREPDLSELPRSVPASVRNAIRLCLQKDLALRVRDVGDVLLVLDGAFEEAGSREVAGGAARGRLFRRSMVLAVAGLAGAALVAVPVWRLWPRIEPQQMDTFPGGRIGANVAVGIAFSRDGRRLAAFRQNPPSIIVRSRGEDDWRSLSLTEGLVSGLCFAPDGDRIAYAWESREIRTIPFAGGVPVTVAREQLNPLMNCDWGDDDWIYFDSFTGIMRTPADDCVDCADTLIRRGEDERDQYVAAPQLLPGGEFFMYGRNWAGNPKRPAGEVVVVDLATRSPKVVTDVLGNPTYVRSESDPYLGHIAYSYGNSVYAVPFNVRRVEAGTGVYQFLYDVSFHPEDPSFAWAKVSGTGTLAYFRGSAGSTTVQWLDRSGTLSPTSIPAGTHFSMALSPQTDLAVLATIGDSRDGGSNLELHDFRSSASRLTHEGYANAPVWFPDSLRIAYAFYPDATSRTPEIRVVFADLSMPEISLGAIAGTESAMPTSIDPGATVLIGHAKQSGRDDRDLWIIPLNAPSETDDDGPLSPRFLLETFAEERHPTFSPDGSYFAYSSNESGQPEIYVRPYSGPDAPVGAREKVSIDGGHEPRWNTDGTLTYLNGNLIMAVVVTTTPEFRIEEAAKSVADRQASFSRGLGDTFFSLGNQYDVDEDGDRFLVFVAQDVAPLELYFRLNWAEELRQRVPFPDSW